MERGADDDGDGQLLRTFLLAVVAVTLVLAAVVTARVLDRDTDPGRYTEASLEHQLASSDGVPTAEAELERYRAALQAAALRCRESPEELAQLAVEARDVLAGDQVRVTTLDVLGDVSRGGFGAGSSRPLTRGGGTRRGCGPVFEGAVVRLARCAPQGARACGY